jgi:sialic acid synthase SpsE
MVSLAELDEVVDYITSRNSPLTVLYCVSEYPCPPEYFNLSTIEHFKEKYPNVIIGFSDHSVGDITIPLAAVKMGAQVLEKHFSFSRDLWGSDHKASITPEEMKALIQAIKSNDHQKVDTDIFYGNKKRELEGAKNKFRPYFNKSLVAACDIPKGTVITEDMVYAMRPRMHIDGLPAHYFHSILNKKAKKDLKKYEPISKKHINAK